jgi:hypothetical protein
MSAIHDIMNELCQKYGIRQTTVERLLEAENSKRDLRRRKGLPEQLRKIIDEEAESVEGRRVTQED